MTVYKRSSKRPPNPIHQEYVMHQHPEYVMQQKRLETFRYWPKETTQSPHKLAEAGFVSSGSGDAVYCFHCGVHLEKWEKNDMPWKEHAKWSPRCRYVKMVKGDKFIIRWGPLEMVSVDTYDTIEQ
uniref:Baculoviral IAP repeat-containing protein n=1 Tax=Penaeus semisulcatus majanivirus TaxID=2984274 RepID=A0A9C7BLW1_9VIRU|nr:MAG: baculoviral IAP repeat-containing protein [Penaeus semisulcatus majanivirus]